MKLIRNQDEKTNKHGLIKNKKKIPIYCLFSFIYLFILFKLFYNYNLYWS